MLKLGSIVASGETVRVDGVDKVVEGVRWTGMGTHTLTFTDGTELMVRYRETVEVILSLFLFCFFISFPVAALADSRGDYIKERMVNAIIGEAEGEPYKGKLAVACAIINRTRTYGSFEKAMKGVYGEHAPRVTQRKYSSEVFVDAVRAYEESLDVGTCDFIDGADHWEGTKFPLPSWARNMKVTAVIGNQKFFREK